MAMRSPSPLKIEVEVIENGFLLIKGRTKDYAGKRTYCADANALAYQVESIARMWGKFELVKKHGSRPPARKIQLTFAQKKQMAKLAKGGKIMGNGNKFSIAGNHVDPRTVKALEDARYIVLDKSTDLWTITEEGKESVDG
jgi:hypothetical protein